MEDGRERSKDGKRKGRGSGEGRRDKGSRKRAFGMDGFIPFAPQNSHGGSWTELLFF